MKVKFKDISHTKKDKGRTFAHHCILEVETTEDNGSIKKTKEQGYMLQGKDVIFLNAAKIYPPQDESLMDGQYVPLMTDAKDIVGAINELFLSCSGGGDVFIVSGSESGISVTLVKNRGDNQELTAEFFTFKTNTYKTVTTVSAGSTSIDKIWSKTIISEILYNGETVWDFELDDSGEVTAVFDSVGNDIKNGITGEGGKSVLTSTPEGIALGWALAYNKEQNEALKKIIDAYRDGIDDCDKINEAEGVSGDGSGDDGSGDNSGDGSGGDGTGGVGIKLPNKTFEAMELPANTGTGCKITYERHVGYQVFYVTEYCEYAVTYRAQSGLGIARYNGALSSKQPNGTTVTSSYDSARGTFAGVAGIFNIKVSGDIRDPDGLLS